MIPHFLESPRLELPHGWVFDVTPRFDVAVMRRGNQGEKRNLVSPRGRVEIQVHVPSDKVADVPRLLRWYRACRGKAVGFRVQDPTDYLSTMTGHQLGQGDPAPTALDQPIVEIGGVLQLVKQYRISEDTDALVEERPILKPVHGQIMVANAAGVTQAPSSYTVNDLGEVVAGGGFTGTPYSWGGQFDVPVRFDSDMPMRVEEFRLRDVAFTLLELMRKEEVA